MSQLDAVEYVISASPIEGSIMSVDHNMAAAASFALFLFVTSL